MSAITVIRHGPPPLVGVCVPTTDHRFQELEAALSWVEANGVIVDRIDPVTDSAQPRLVPEAARLGPTKGASVLPLVVVDGHAASQGHFPSRHELAHLDAAEDAARHAVHATTR